MRKEKELKLVDNNLRYADDAVVMTDNEADLPYLVSTVNGACKDYGMAMNVKKTKTMVIIKCRDTQCSITVDGNILEQVSQFLAAGLVKTVDVISMSKQELEWQKMHFGSINSY